MIMNLFSIFDPSIFILSFSPWFFIFIMFIINLIGGFKKSKYISFLKIIILFIRNEIKPLLGVFSFKGIILMYLGVFISLLLINFFSLFPFIFTGTAHIILAFPFAFVFWIGIMVFGWIYNRKHIIAHIVPLGTPLVLINFMVLIELISNIIRPITLSVRLTANIVAGHLLLRLLGSFSLIRYVNFSLSFLGIIILSLLELSVAFIQSYVFITLITLYSTEIH